MYADVATINYTAFPDKKERAPTDPPAVKSQLTDDILSNDPNQYSQLTFRCKPEDREGSTPGGVLAAVTTQAFTSDWNTIAAADDLTPYLSAIFDAAVNRLKKEGVKGMQKATQDMLSDNGRAGYTAPVTAADDPTLTNIKNAYAAAQLDASSTSALLKTATSQNSTVESQLNTLIACQAVATSSSCASTTSKLATIGQSAAQLTVLANSFSDITNTLAKIGKQINAKTALSATDMATLSSVVDTIRNQISSLALSIQKIIDDTMPDANRVPMELSICATAVKNVSNIYLCPVW